MARILIFWPDKALNALAATPAWLRMPMPMTETFATSVAPSSRSEPIAPPALAGGYSVPPPPRVADGALGLVEGHSRTLIVRGWNREGEVGGRAVGRDVLHDHIHVDVVIGKRAKDRGRDPGLVLHPTD